MQAFIFDMDGVIVDTELVHMRAEMDTAEAFGIKLTHEELIPYQGSSDEQLFGDIIKKRQLDIALEKICAYKKDLFNRTMREQGATPIEGILDLINEAARSELKTAIASSSTPDFIDFVVDDLKIRAKFDVLVSGALLAESKPNPEIYLLTAKKLGVNPKDCVVLEDTNNGARAAKAAGMYCIGFRSPHSGVQDFSMVDEIVDSIADIDLRKF